MWIAYPRIWGKYTMCASLLDNEADARTERKCNTLCAEQYTALVLVVIPLIRFTQLLTLITAFYCRA